MAESGRIPPSTGPNAGPVTVLNRSRVLPPADLRKKGRADTIGAAFLGPTGLPEAVPAD